MIKRCFLVALLAMGVTTPAWSQEMNQFGDSAGKCDPSIGHCVSTIVFSNSPTVSPASVLLDIYRISMNEDGTPNRDTLTRLTHDEVGVNGLVGSNVLAKLSRDGKKIVFDSNRNRSAAEPLNTSDLFLMKADGKDQTLLIRGSSATWSPNSKYVAFHASASGAPCLRSTPPPFYVPGCPIKADPGAATWDSDIFIMRVPDDADAVVEAPINITNTPQYIEDDADWSPDGTRLVFTRHLVVGDNPNNSSTAEVCVLTLATLHVECVTQNSTEERAAAWSPGGTRIAYMCRNLINVIFEICVMNADGTEQTQLTNNSVLDATPTWSPDGEKILFQHGAFAAPTQPWVMNANGTGQTPLVDPPVLPGANYAPSWGLLWVGGKD